MGFWTLRVRGKAFEGFVGYAHDAPLGEHVGAELLVKGDGRGVPGKDIPLEAGATLGKSNLG